MKKIFFTLLLIFFLFSNNVYASENVNFSCDYSFKNSEGIVKFRIKASSVDKKYFKSKQERDKADINYWKNHINGFYLDSNNTFQPLSMNECTKEYNNANKQKLCILSSSYSRLAFINASAKSEDVACPNIYYSDNGNINVIMDSSYLGVDGNMVSSTPVALNSMNCYDNATDTTPTKCNKIELGQLYSEDKKECEYTTNVSNTTFKLIYSKSTNELEFYTMGADLKVDAGVSTTVKNGKTYILDNNLLSTFSSSSSCPKYISCNCRAGAALSSNRVCSFSEENAKNNCGVLKSIDGTGNGDNGTDPNAPNLNIYGGEMDCYDILGENLTKIVHLAISILRVAGAIIVIVNAMLAILPAVHDPDKINSAKKKCINMAIVLALIGLLPTLIRFIGNLMGLDLSCF